MRENFNRRKAPYNQLTTIYYVSHSYFAKKNRHRTGTKLEDKEMSPFKLPCLKSHTTKNRHSQEGGWDTM
jgi:hypothetical protein